ncbi:formimidoylglutamase [Vibrio cyclitrophicus]|uniref:formimidoylglutamase n=1 Tax=Vibrio cyclitrophicus TaxID=47951 RepID=UPI0007EECA59|nr:formimidoylglutamase [Vibrio cyclitrophicus]OBS98405.1 formimidoylglutamase [Vibrio cyclitrophicus]PME92146.1 formimidoylglutamase [Vibrio cyclitrophicus]PMF20400.1 formimidoylglutamase [Vibrio cyclitrophicus]PMH21501.1 formimidoylglutamase [Vibrio cyclitrophicus]PMH40783.1 formimidoylglutamase [Vibrio cyclitrophicus]
MTQSNSNDINATAVTSHNFVWTGRNDLEDGALGTRVHHITNQVQNNELTDGSIALVGFASDAGVARNKGRVGAKQAPNLIRQALANMAWHSGSQIADLGDIECNDGQLEVSQKQCASVIANALATNKVITLGGGHEVAWASFQGLAEHLHKVENLDKAERLDKDQPEQKPKIGIVNFDAHFDLREFESDIADVKPSSGTPFNQISDYCHKHQWPFQYACLGVSAASNTKALFNKADQLGVWYEHDRNMTQVNQVAQLIKLQKFITECDYLYLTIDLDVFPAATAPGVSAPAARGVSYEALAPFLEQIFKHSEKLIIADIAEYNPDYDIDGQTARLAARLCWDIASAMASD